MKTKLIIAFVVFSAVGGGLFYLLTAGNIGVKYNTVTVKRGEIKQYVQDVGRISSKNIREYYGIGLGKVESIPLELGDPVEKGQLLIQYENNLGLEIQKVEKQIKALEATYREAASGTDMASVNSSKIEISRIKNDLDAAIINKERTETLYSNGAASLFELEQAVSRVEQLRSILGVAQNTYGKLTKGLSENIKEKYEAEIDVLLLSLEILERRKNDYLVYADIEGVVTELNTFEGDNPSPGLLILEIQDPSEKVILVDFMVEDAMRIKPDMQAEILDLNLNIQLADLAVSRVYPKAFVMLSELGVEENRQTVEIGLPKSSDALAYGLELATKVTIESPREVLLIPEGSVFQDKSKYYVKVLVDGKIVEREINTGIKVDSSIEVIDGLEEGEQVLLNYQEE